MALFGGGGAAYLGVGTRAGHHGASNGQGGGVPSLVARDDGDLAVRGDEGSGREGDEEKLAEHIENGAVYCIGRELRATGRAKKREMHESTVSRNVGSLMLERKEARINRPGENEADKETRPRGS